MSIQERQLLQAPGPRGFPIVGNLHLFLSPNVLLKMMSLREEYGDVIQWRVGPRLVHFINDLDAIKRVLQMNNRNYTKAQAYNKLELLLGKGLLTSESDFWRRQRRLAQPAFHRHKIALLAEGMVGATRRLLEGLEPLAESGEAFDINKWMMQVTMDIVARSLFSTALAEEDFQRVANALDFLLHETIRRAMAPWFVELPTRKNRRYHRHIDELNQIVMRIISERRESGEKKPDLLGMLLEAHDEETGEGMDDLQLRDEVMTLFLAGHETTANALTWLWKVLSHHPTVQKAVVDEVEDVLEGRDPSADDIAKLTYSRRVLDEVMRLYPPVPFFARRAIQEDTLCGYTVPAGSNVVISPYILHRLEDLWTNPEGFDPDRFTEEAKKQRNKFAYLPFGGGPRFCIGNHFAIMEALIVMSMMLQRYRVDLVPYHPIEFELSLTLRPKHGLLTRLRPR